MESHPLSYNSLQNASGRKYSQFKNWYEAFFALEEWLGSLPEGKKIVFFDELPWIFGGFLLTILADISRKRTEPERIFTEIARNNFDNTTRHCSKKFTTWWKKLSIAKNNAWPGNSTRWLWTLFSSAKISGNSQSRQIFSAGFGVRVHSRRLHRCWCLYSSVTLVATIDTPTSYTQ